MHFMEVLVGRALHPYQGKFGLRLIESVLINDGQTISALFRQQGGRSETVAHHGAAGVDQDCRATSCPGWSDGWSYTVQTFRVSGCGCAHSSTAVSLPPRRRTRVANAST